MITLKRIAAVAVVGIAAVAFAQSGRIELLANLQGVGKGKATWKVDDRAREKQAELEAEGERLAPNTAYSITIGSNPAFAVTTNNFGCYHLSKRYNSLDRPTIAVGDVVNVSDVNNTIVQSGVFRNK